MTDEELRDLIRTELDDHQQPSVAAIQDVVRTAVTETLITLGMDASDPIKLQQDMAFLRDFRSAHETLKSKGLMVLIGIVVTGLAGAVWLGIKSTLGGGS